MSPLTFCFISKIFVKYSIFKYFVDQSNHHKIKFDELIFQVH